MEQYKSTHTGEQIDTAVDKVINEDLPIASSTKLGGIKVGENLSITSDGVLSASGGSSGGGTKLYKHTLVIKATFYWESSKAKAATDTITCIAISPDNSIWTKNNYYKHIIISFSSLGTLVAGGYDRYSYYSPAYIMDDQNIDDTRIRIYDVNYADYARSNGIDSLSDTVTEI